MPPVESNTEAEAGNGAFDKTGDKRADLED